MLALGHLPASIIDMGGYPKEGISRPTRGRVSGCWGCPHPERKEELTAHVPSIILHFAFMPVHTSVLLQQVLKYLAPSSGETVVDATFGFGGHAREILKKIGAGGKLIGIETDREVIAKAEADFPTLQIVHGNFRDLKTLLEKNGVRKVDGILFDLGVSSYHFDTSGRGFSFAKDEPLDMRLDESLPRTAADLVNSMNEKELADLFYHLADEYASRRIAAAIVRARQKDRITRTLQLAEIVRCAKARRFSRIHPATKVFQALRIAVNDELEALKQALPQAIELLKKDGRIVVISFHSGEDRLVKNKFKSSAQSGEIDILTKKPTVAEPLECRENPRARSAKLRAAKRR